MSAGVLGLTAFAPLLIILGSSGNAQTAAGVTVPGTRGGSLVVHADYDHEFVGTCDPITVTVRFRSEVTGGQPPYVYLWRFGDGSTSSDPNPSHTYMDAIREYTVVLWVSSLGGVATDSFSLGLAAPSCADPVRGGPAGNAWSSLVVIVPLTAVAAVLAGSVLRLWRKR